MKKFVITLILLCSLTACGTMKSLQAESDSTMPYRNHQTHFVSKPYKIIGRVRGEYSRWCFLAGLFCFGDDFIYDDLLRKGQKQGGNEVINVVRETEGVSPLWFLLFSHENTVANGLTIYVQPGDKH